METTCVLGDVELHLPQMASGLVSRPQEDRLRYAPTLATSPAWYSCPRNRRYLRQPCVRSRRNFRTARARHMEAFDPPVRVRRHSPFHLSLPLRRNATPAGAHHAIPPANLLARAESQS